ncbi:hypothetical protein OOZ63_21775 [Paucibacter sp. PLA-PC-4]|uniref:hypothetical protein n=1 Tax=Paucibacter sp. PLA-PC-4 TaxID=2993655 RepID=UPI00224B67E2|nr:hypothetical protein [Paucibacter sp. PLA-PC-4]MCX2864463.1 hypothetical protein [Paucibacter sp. PLA-PC-4]
MSSKTTVAAGTLIALASLLGGCTSLDVPKAENYPASSQKKARAVHHWDVLAGDVAQRVATKLLGDTKTPHAPLPPLYLLPAVEPSSFHQSFRSLLMARLLEQGIRVASEPGSAALQMSIEAQVVRHSERTPNSNPLPFTTLAAGVHVLRDLVRHEHSSLSVVGSTLALGALADGARLAREGNAAGGPTGSEVLISTAISAEGTYLARTADVYYVEADNAALYLPAPAQAVPLMKTWKVVGDR